MGRYSIVLSDLANRDISDIFNDLVELTGETGTAVRVTDKIYDKIEKLSDFPGMCPLYEQSPFSGKGIRFLSAENHSVLYNTDDKRCIVNILRVYNARRAPKKINIQ